ncbi:MAG TPA: hydrogenase maturation protease [Polyangia bacterium]|jgi:hydrogenase maturation protease
MSARVVVAGIGNVFLGDDGFGVEVAGRLADRPLPDGVVVLDIGVRALHLAFELLDRPGLLLVVDAVDRGERPGTVTLIEPALDGDAGGAAEAEIADAHSMNLTTVLTAVRNLGAQMPPVLLVGCQPEFIGERMGLSPTVEGAVPRAVALVEATITRLIESKEETAS